MNLLDRLGLSLMWVALISVLMGIAYWLAAISETLVIIADRL